MGKNTGEAAEDSNVQGPSDVNADDAQEDTSDIQETSTDVQEGPSGVQDEPGDVYDSLWLKEWDDIPNAPYVVKYIFSEDCYTILVSNLCELYGENLAANEVQERFSILNPHAEMKSNVIMKYLKEELEKFLEEKNLPEHDTENFSKFSYQCSSKTTAFHLIFKVHQVSFAFEIKPQLLPREKFRAHVIAPTICASHSMFIDIIKCKRQCPRTQLPSEAAEDFNVQGPSDVKADDAQEDTFDNQETSTDVQEGPSGIQDESGDVYDSLWLKEWADIPNAPYVVKYIFSEDCYTILVSNLCKLYGENLAANEVQERFSILNPHAVMKSNVIMKYLKKELEQFLEEKNLPKHDTENSSKFNYQCSLKTTAFHLTFKVHQVSFEFEIKPQLLPREKFLAHVIAPTICASHSMFIDIIKSKRQCPRPRSPCPDKPHLAENEAKPKKRALSTQACSISVAEEFKSSATSMKQSTEVSEATEGALTCTSNDEFVLKKKKKKFNF